MLFNERVAILADGEFLKKTLSKRLRSFPDTTAVLAELERIRKHPDVSTLALYRIFFYSAEPIGGSATHPLTKAQLNFGASPAYANNTKLLSLLDASPDVAVRRGQLVKHGWRIKGTASEALAKGKKAGVVATDIEPNLQQKGVDMRIGLDMASLALKRLVSTVVVVTADSDLVPAMKFARREGLRVYLDTLGGGRVRPELKVHADRVLS